MTGPEPLPGALPGDLTEFTLTEAATIRLISTAYIDEPALSPLADDDGDLAILEELEGLTSARRSLNLPLPGGLQEAELRTAADGYGWTYVNAAFCYTRPTGNRFNGSERGAWYACFGDNAVETAQAEVCWHLTRELEATGVFENTTAYRELIAGFTSQFADLRDQAGAACLHPDPAQGYSAGQALARAVFEAGGNGLLYPSVWHDQGQCLVALRPYMVQNIRQGATWVFEWAGAPEPEIARG